MKNKVCLTDEVADYWKCVSSIAVSTKEFLKADFLPQLQEGVKTCCLSAELPKAITLR